MRWYLAARYERYPEMISIARQLEDQGHSIVSRWISGDHGLDTLSGTDEERASFAIEDMEDIAKCDGLVSFSDEGEITGPHRSRGGRHAEFGMALMLNKRMVVVGEREHIFHWLPSVEIYATLEDFIKTLNSEREEETV